MKVFNRGVDINVSNEDALKVNGTKIIDKDGKIYGDIHAAAGSIGTTELADDAVTADKLADNAVVTANIVAKNVTGEKIANKAVDTAQIADGAIEALQINANAVETAKIKDANVTGDKIANKAVDTAQIADGAIEALQINTDAVETAKIKDLNVTAGKLAADAVETAKIKDANVTLGKLAAGITPSHIVKFLVSGSTITDTTLVGLAVDDLIVTITATGVSVATCGTADTLPFTPGDTDSLLYLEQQLKFSFPTSLNEELGVENLIVNFKQDVKNKG